MNQTITVIYMDQAPDEVIPDVTIARPDMTMRCLIVTTEDGVVQSYPLEHIRTWRLVPAPPAAPAPEPQKK